MSAQNSLITWYSDNKRNLPWRTTLDPFFIWLSEVILQQTRVNQGLGYYLRFTDAFPTIFDLARAQPDEVLKLWQGLGYYTRARNLHKAAQVIVRDYQGVFPCDYDSIRKLPGIGDYTAAAIASFAFGLPHAVVDGNVYRVLSRYFANASPIDSTQGKKLFAQLAQEFLNRNEPALHNQAIMELGAMVCTPTQPSCSICPLADRCAGYATGNTALFPVKGRKTVVRTRFFYYFILLSQHKIAVRQREENDIWKGLFEFPMWELDQAFELKELILLPEIKSFIQNGKVENYSSDFTHKLTHQTIKARFCAVRLPDNLVNTDNFSFVDIHEINNLAVSRLIDRYLKTAEFHKFCVAQ
jgi:A/G-specific adenine glycosylase